MAEANEPGTLNTLAPEAPPAARPDPAYYRCAPCGYVVGPQLQTPVRCPNCTTHGGFAPTEIVFPARPSDEAIERDTRPLEAAIRAAYARLAQHRNDLVSLADVRAALPADLDRETVDAALTKLAAHTDVHLFPRRDQKQADPATQQAALNLGGGYSHILTIDSHRDMTATLLHVRSTSRIQADSILAPLTDTDVSYLAERMNVDSTGTAEDVRRRIAEQAEANRQAWLADARQGEADGTLLYRADNDPAWVAGWTDADRRAAWEAAARLLARADREENWAYVRDRANRWSASPQDGER